MNNLTRSCCSSLAFLAGCTAGSANANALDTKMQAILTDYLKIQDALAADATTGVQAAAREVAAKAKKIEPADLKGEHAEHYADLPAKLSKAAEQVAGAASLGDARQAYKELSRSMAMWASAAKPKGVDVVFCSMANGSWLQKQGDIRNPYYGKEMLACGEIVSGKDAQHAH